MSYSRVIDAARAVVEGRGTPGAMARTNELGDAIAELRKGSIHLDITIAAALWHDRYGTQGAPARLDALAELITELSKPPF